jgi:hypothetical protein
LFWNVRYTGYFYRKYWDRYAARMGLAMGRRTALAIFAIYQVYALFVRPVTRRIGTRIEGALAPMRARRASVVQ